MATDLTMTAHFAAKQGNPLRVLPVRNTATSGVPEGVGGIASTRFVPPKEGLKHIVKHFTLATTGDYFDLGRPVISAAVVFEGAVTGNVAWDPDSATGRITVTASGAGTGWLHIWYNG
ncbi:MAG: hypothetical protein ACYS8L_07940 [Planctomycetota bacterium]|jgi:hypothetical protein